MRVFITKCKVLTYKMTISIYQCIIKNNSCKNFAWNQAHEIMEVYLMEVQRVSKRPLSQCNIQLPDVRVEDNGLQPCSQRLSLKSDWMAKRSSCWWTTSTNRTKLLQKTKPCPGHETANFKLYHKDVIWPPQWSRGKKNRLLK